MTRFVTDFTLKNECETWKRRKLTLEEQSLNNQASNGIALGSQLLVYYSRYNNYYVVYYIDSAKKSQTLKDKKKKKSKSRKQSQSQKS